MRRFIFSVMLICSIALSFTLVGCGSDSDSTSSGPSWEQILNDTYYLLIADLDTRIIDLFDSADADGAVFIVQRGTTWPQLQLDLAKFDALDDGSLDPKDFKLDKIKAFCPIDKEDEEVKDIIKLDKGAKTVKVPLISMSGDEFSSWKGNENYDIWMIIYSATKADDYTGQAEDIYFSSSLTEFKFSKFIEQ